jgi:hypothetical protein
MGVRGVTSLIKKEGWIPSEKKENDSTCSTCLFKDWNPSLAFLNQGLPLQQIRPQSVFLIDGNGLAFHLFKIAYTRNLCSIFKIRGQNDSLPAVSDLSQEEISKALPTMVPLSLVEEVAYEFVGHLRLYDIILRVFWDGPFRRFKTVTDKRRRQQRQEQWSALQQYCVHGVLPNEKNIARFLNHFPVPNLFLRCVSKALRRAQVEIVDCKEEADVELARVASGDATAYVLGQDSDFYFYKNIQYM